MSKKKSPLDVSENGANAAILLIAIGIGLGLIIAIFDKMLNG